METLLPSSSAARRLLSSSATSSRVKGDASSSTLWTILVGLGPVGDDPANSALPNNFVNTLALLSPFDFSLACPARLP